MPCNICSDRTSILYSNPDGNVLIELCPKHAAKQPLLKPVTLQTAQCRQCPHLGKCCRTTNMRKE